MPRVSDRWTRWRLATSLPPATTGRAALVGRRSRHAAPRPSRPAAFRASPCTRTPSRTARGCPRASGNRPDAGDLADPVTWAGRRRGPRVDASSVLQRATLSRSASAGQPHPAPRPLREKHEVAVEPCGMAACLAGPRAPATTVRRPRATPLDPPAILWEPCPLSHAQARGTVP